jgi:hypothetical protein
MGTHQSPLIRHLIGATRNSAEITRADSGHGRGSARRLAFTGRVGPLSRCFATRCSFPSSHWSLARACCQPTGQRVFGVGGWRSRRARTSRSRGWSGGLRRHRRGLNPEDVVVGSSGSGRSDAELFAADAEAFGCFYARHDEFVLAVFLRRVGSGRGDTMSRCSSQIRPSICPPRSKSTTAQARKPQTTPGFRATD